MEDPRLIKKTTLRSLLSKASNYREPSTINYSKFKLAIGPSINACIESLKTSFKDNDLNDCEDFVTK